MTEIILNLEDFSECKKLDIDCCYCRSMKLKEITRTNNVIKYICQNCRKFVHQVIPNKEQFPNTIIIKQW